ncbi:hypothetical protein D9757_000914 [Collybiopsis confluens]|uniref:DUF6534 domain-containing protein n=1 Tax=Collybiopsis confluens TaxID=2823264 RepID=A0A8H5I0N8_9AGAR|nr:hypothetical protein D9757_000914 [Collybiopsis confluens]
MIVNSTSPTQGPVADLSMALSARFPNASSSATEFSALTDVPVFLGFMLAYFLNGILFVQVYAYFVSFRHKDHCYLQIIVLAILIIECASTVCATATVVYSIIVHGNLAYSVLVPSFEAVAVLTGVASSVVHALYCWRIQVLGGHWATIVVIIILSLTQCVFVSESGPGASVFWSAVLDEPGNGLKPAVAIPDMVWLAVTALCDIIITCTILYLQRRILKDIDKGSRLAGRVKKLMGIAIDTSMITAVAAILEFYPLPKLYANCALATLNARLTLTGKGSRESMASDLEAENSAKTAFDLVTINYLRFPEISTKITVPCVPDNRRCALCLANHAAGKALYLGTQYRLSILQKFCLLELLLQIRQLDVGGQNHPERRGNQGNSAKRSSADDSVFSDTKPGNQILNGKVLDEIRTLAVEAPTSWNTEIIQFCSLFILGEGRYH